MSNGDRHYSAWGLVIEPSVGLGVPWGRAAMGARLAISKSTEETVMPTFINARAGSPPDLFLTLFADYAL